MPADDDLSWPADAVEVARVLDAWGVKGWFHVQSYASDAQAVFAAKRWFLLPPEGKLRPKDAPALPGVLQILQAKVHGDGIVASAQGVADRVDAEALRGARVFVSRSSFPKAADGEYYWIDLLGLTVVNRSGELLGTVTDLIDTGAHSVLRLSFPDADDKGQPVEGERLIPFVGAYIDSVQLEHKRIVADWGLDY
jgi:16S rRNA processing protein RimM